MPLNPVNIIAPVNKDVDQILTSNSAVDLDDVYLVPVGDELYAQRRPGVEAFSTISGAGKLSGLYYWDESSVTIGVSGGIVYSIATNGAATSIGSGLEADTRVSFATIKISGTQVLAMANGGSIYYTDGATVTKITDTQAPTACTHVASINRRILANNSDAFLYWSDVNDLTSWAALSFAEAERKPDDIIAIHVQGRDVVLFGFRSVEFYYDDAGSFRRFEGGEVETGVSAAYSIQFIPEINSWIYLDENRHLVKLEGRVPTKISGPYDKEIQALSVASDAESDLIRVDGLGFYIISFPSDNKTFVYDYQLNAWYRWGKWNSGTNGYDRFIGNVATYDTRNKRHLVGDVSNGIVYDMKASVYQDNGNEIRSHIRSAYIDHGTLNGKRSKMLQFRLKRGVAKDTSDNAGVINIKYRDEDERDFSNEREVGTGKGGASEFRTRLFNNGIYYARQWDIVSSDNTPFIIGDFEEDIEVLRH